MTQHSEDRRSLRTRDLLQQALNRLALKRGYDAISVKDICDEANVGRSTFYAHFADKDDLKRSGFAHLRRQLAQLQHEARATAGPDDHPGLSFSLPTFEHAGGHAELYRAMVGGQGSAIALGAIRDILSELVRKSVDTAGEESPGSGLPREFVVRYLVGAYMSVLTWWLDSGTRLPPEQVDRMFRQLATAGVFPGAAPSADGAADAADPSVGAEE